MKLLNYEYSFNFALYYSTGYGCTRLPDEILAVWGHDAIFFEDACNKMSIMVEGKPIKLVKLINV